jgi:branched-chain amino acid transport system substrate-binding protein
MAIKTRQFNPTRNAKGGIASMSTNSRGVSRRRFLGGSAVALTAGTLGMPFVRTARAQASTFKAGVITSLSGENILGGNLTKRGYDLWADAINA